MKEPCNATVSTVYVTDIVLTGCQCTLTDST